MKTLDYPNATNTSADAQFAVIVERLAGRLQAGEALDPELLVAEFPEYAQRLQQLLPAMQLLTDASRPGAQPLAFPAGDDHPGEALGDFRLIREVGRGGMGVVYEAEQLSLNRCVALKVLPFAATMDAKQLQRFKNEAKAAASLKHDHIVPIYAVGCERGVHFYAMEFVEGQTLAQFIVEVWGGEKAKPAGFGLTVEYTPDNGAPSSAAEQGLQSPKTKTTPVTCPAADTAPIAALSTERIGPRGRQFHRRAAQLIADAADALEHAHALGIVHRDIKPGNLLLDAAGKLYVSDFGLARFGPDAGLTMSGDLLGTLRYMAPEQALARHGLADHRVDVYGLGCTLYELLTGRPAVAGEDKADIVRRIAFEEPTGLRKVDRAIPAELETITLKCLAKNPNERYSTAGELAEDLRRWLTHQTIRARRPSLAQRADKWMRRHSAAVLATTAALLIGTGVSTWQAIKARDAQRQAATEAAIAREVSDFLRHCLLGPPFGAPQAYRFFGGNAGLTMKEALDRGAARIGQRFNDQPLVEAEIRTVIGNAYVSLEEFQSAAVHLERALALRDQYLGPGHPDSLAIMTGLAMSWTNLGRAPEAIDLYQQVIRIRNARFGSDDVETLYNMQLLGVAYWAAGRPDASVQILEPLVERQSRICGPTHTDTIGTMHHLGMVYGSTGRLSESVSLHEKALELRMQFYGPKHQVTSEYMLLLAGAYERTDDLLRANEVLRQAIQVIRGKGGLLAERRSLADALGRLARNELLRLQYAAAEPPAREALKIDLALADECPRNPDYRHQAATSHSQLGHVLRWLGKLPDAELECRAAIKLLAALVADFPRVPEYRRLLAENQGNLGIILGEQDKLPESRIELSAARAVFTQLAVDFPNVPEDRWVLALWHSLFGSVLMRQQKATEAANEFRAGQSILAKLSTDFPQKPNYRNELAASHFNIGMTLEAQGKLSEAADEYRACIQIRETLAAKFPNGPSYRCDLPRWHNDLGAVLTELGRLAEAEAEFRQVLAGLTSAASDSPEDAVVLGGVECNLGELGCCNGRPADSLEWFGRAIATLEQVLQKSPEIGGARQYLANSHDGRAKALQALNRFAEALVDWNRVIELDTKAKRPVDRCMRACCMAHLDLAAAIAEIDQLMKEESATAEITYSAACIYSLAAAGQAQDAARLGDIERARLRRQALDWLTADLNARAKTSTTQAERLEMRKHLQHWQKNSDFSSVRGDEALAKLPEAERAGWRKLWAEVAELLKRTENPNNAKKPTPTS